MTSQASPEPLPAHVDHHEGRDGENCPRHQRFTHRGGGARQVLLQHPAAKERQTKQRYGNHRRWNRGGYRLAGLHAQVGVCRAENGGHEDTGHNGFDCELGLFGIGGNEGFEFGHGYAPIKKQ